MRSKVFHPESGLAGGEHAFGRRNLARWCGWAGVGTIARVSVVVARLPCFLSIASPLAETFAESRGTDRNSGSFQFLDQLAAAPAFAMEGQQPFAQRFQRISGGPALLGRFLLAQLFQFLFDYGVIEFCGQLAVINTCFHATSLSLFAVAVWLNIERNADSFWPAAWRSIEQPMSAAASSP